MTVQDVDSHFQSTTVVSVVKLNVRAKVMGARDICFVRQSVYHERRHTHVTHM